MNAELRVGDHVRYVYSTWPPARILEFTERGGFRWRMDEPHSLGPRYGWVQDGEAFALEGWVVQ